MKRHRVASGLVLVALSSGIAFAEGPARLLGDLDPTPWGDGSNPGYFFRFGNVLLFRTTTTTLGAELWGADGTETGVALLESESQPAHPWTSL